EIEIIRENHKFIRNQDDDTDDAPWEQRAAKKYYDKLFKEYAIGELKYYKESKIALRWRTEGEVVSGKGQFVCASTRCDSTRGLESWEVNFRYVEDKETKNELVKIRLCPACSDKLNYTTQKRLAKKEKKRKRQDESSKTTRKKTKESCSQSPSEDEVEEKNNGKKDRLPRELDSNYSIESEASNVWKQAAESRDEKSKEEEFEDYFADLLQ
ncbi:folate-sensitive fragile site protein Fra10Ac1-domain-containing protein, partial [Phycomyces nitens]